MENIKIFINNKKIVIPVCLCHKYATLFKGTDDANCPIENDIANEILWNS